MNHLDLFSGIGGFSLGLERAGIKTIAFCEFDKHAQKVLKKHWPDVPIYSDVRELTHERLKSDGINGIDIITGGFPCQDISIAGKQAGIKEGTRSGLWSECARLVGEIRPKYAIFENVTALLSGEQGRWFQRVLFDLSEIGYDAEWHCIPASELGAHHHRDRVWIIAYPSIKRWNNGCDHWQERHLQENKKRVNQEVQRQGNKWELGTCSACTVLSNPMREGLEGHREPRGNEKDSTKKRQSIFSPYSKGSIKSNCWPIEPNVGRVADGIPNRSHRLKQLGNAVVPQIPEIIGQAIMQVELNKGIK